MGNYRMRRALLVGCNYQHAPKMNPLKGCINDVVRMFHDYLGPMYGFEAGRINLMIDEQRDPALRPTGQNIKARLRKMIDDTKAGELLLFYFSGHGTRIPSNHHSGKDEAIVASDGNPITCHDFRRLVDRLPKGAKFVMISDSCHSGGLIGHETEQIGPSSHRNLTHSRSQVPHNARFVPFESIIEHLGGARTSTPNATRDLMVQSFGEHASRTFRLSQSQLNSSRYSKPDGAILLTGCQADEFSFETKYEGTHYGAFSTALLKAVKRKNHFELSNKAAVMFARKQLKAEDKKQHPCLYCSDSNVDKIFLRPNHKTPHERQMDNLAAALFKF